MSAVDWVPDEVAGAVDILIEVLGHDEGETWLQERKQDAERGTDEHETVMAALAELRRRDGSEIE